MTSVISSVRHGAVALVAACVAVVAAEPAAQQTAPLKGTLERLTVHGRALEGNLEGDSPASAKKCC